MEKGNRVAAPDMRISAPPEDRPQRSKRGVLAAVLIAAVVVLLCLGALLSPQFVPGIYDHVSVMGVDMSRMTVEQARSAWEKAGQQLCDDTKLTLVAEGETLTECSLTELGVSVPADDAALTAWNACHGGNVLQNALALGRSVLGQSMDLTPPLTVDSSVLDARADDIVAHLNCTVVDGEYHLDENGDKGPGLYITKPSDGRVVDGAQLRTAVRTHMEQRDLSDVVCAYKSSEAMQVDVQAMYDALHGQVQESTYDRETGKPTPSRVGVEFDVADVQAQLKAARPGETFLAKAEVTFPRSTEELMAEAMFRDVLGTYTTKVSGSYVRINNVHLAANCINGKIYNPGEEFWYNATVGQRTEARGFGAAPAYVGGKTVDTVGGGVCQVSSTLYYATLLANLQIVLRYCHQFAPAYITWGCDATVSWNGPDYAFRNNTPYPIKIVTDWKDNNLTCTILGTKTDDTYVKMVSQTLSSTGWSEVYEVNPELPYGSEPVVVQTPYTGYLVKTYRQVYDGNDNLISSTFEATSNYESRDRIIQVPPDYYGYTAPADDGGFAVTIG